MDDFTCTENPTTADPQGVRLLFGDDKGTIIGSASTYWPDVQRGSWGDVPCIKDVGGCTWGASTSSAYVEVRLDQQDIVSEIAWSGFGYSSVSFSYKTNSADSSWTAFGPALSGSLSPYIARDVGPISELRFQMSGPHWCKVHFLRVFGTSSAGASLFHWLRTAHFGTFGLV